MLLGRVCFRHGVRALLHQRLRRISEPMGTCTIRLELTRWSTLYQDAR